MTTSTRSNFPSTSNKNTRKPFGALTDSSLNHIQKGPMSKNAKKKRTNPSSPAETKASPQKKKRTTDAVAAKEAPSDTTSIVQSRRTGLSTRPIAAQMVMLPQQQQQPVTPDRTQSLLQSPQKGDRFRVFFDRADDAFGKDTVRAQGYFFGTVLKAETTARAASSRRDEQQQQQYPKYKLTLQFDSGETPERLDYCPTTVAAANSSEDAPEVTIERLVASNEDGSSRLLTGEITGDFAGDLNPARLDVGDLVFCRYQNNDTGTQYRGRIAAVTKDGTSCDIAYDDNEYEEKIPVGKNNIMLVEDGRSHMHWLEGLTMKFPIGASKRKALVTIRTSKDDDTVTLVHANGNEEQQAYSRVVAELFDDIKSECTQKLIWPKNKVASNGIRDDTQKSTRKRKTNTSRARKSMKGKKNDTTRGPRATLMDVCLPEHFAPDPWMSDVSDDDDDTDQDNNIATITPQRKEMSNSIRNQLWRALNSSESHFGADLLFQMTHFHNQLPNDELCQDLIDLLWKGPLHQKMQFPDCVRIELATKYLDLMKATNGMAAKLAARLPADFLPVFLEQVETPATIYCVAGDEGRFTSAALKRVAQTLNIKNSGASLLSYLLERQMKGYARFQKQSKTTKADLEDFKATLESRALIREVLNSGNTGNTLKSAVKATFSILVHYGHYLSNDFCFPLEECPTVASTEANEKIPPLATALDRAFAAAEVKNLLKTMGRICSYLAWLHCIGEGKQSLYETKYVVRDAADFVISNARFDPSVFLSDVKGMKTASKRLEFHFADMKLQFALSLDKRISGDLGKLVAQLFSLPTQYF